MGPSVDRPSGSARANLPLRLRHCAGPRRSRRTAAKGLQAVGQLAGVAHRDHVAAFDLVDLEAQPLAGDPSLEVEREHPIVAAC